MLTNTPVGGRCLAGVARLTPLCCVALQGAFVANYPYDGTPSGITAYNSSPDDGTFRFLARTYASRHAKVSKRCCRCGQWPRMLVTGQHLAMYALWLWSAASRREHSSTAPCPGPALTCIAHTPLHRWPTPPSLWAASQMGRPGTPSMAACR